MRHRSDPTANTRSARVAFWGNFGSLNFGNECTLSAALTAMRERHPDARFLSICRDPADVRVRHAIDAIPITTRKAGSKRLPRALRFLRLMWLEAIEWVRACRICGTFDALLVTGCGILSDKDEGILGLTYELFKWSFVARLRGVRICYVSVGAEDISRPATRRWIRWGLRLAQYRSYRDLNTVSLVQRCGVDTSADSVRPDLAFGLPVPARIIDASRRPSAQSSIQWVAIGLYNYRGRGLASPADAAAYQTYLQSLCTTIERLMAGGHGVRIVLGDLRYDQPVRADLRTELERRGLPLDKGCYEDEPASSFETVMHQLQSVDYVIASRFHSVLLALLLGKPTVAVSYEVKHEALMTSMGLADFLLPIDQLSSDRLVAKFERLKSSAPRWQITRQQVVANRLSLAEQIGQIARLIDMPGNECELVARVRLELTTSAL